MTGYDEDAVKRLISGELRRLSDGAGKDWFDSLAQESRDTARLARQLGVSPATVSRWKDRSKCPAPSYWPGIEEFFGWTAGRIASEGQAHLN